ncbi:Internalin-A [Kordia antarctica]|uniref:Internalin-A n=1 Tax=Kordia antarctica TaxID=1218801 RepID=A0A7L4ZIM8_9FLAO|nr:leucine-rich repeat domain-containing protein [Kordia antarctica]QHI36046.1 Internalin-A [Kordia antarctica]
MARYSKGTGCASYIGITSIVIAAIYLLFTNPNALFEGTINILTALLFFFIMIGLAVILPGISFKSDKNSKNNIKNYEKSRTTVSEKIKPNAKEKKETKAVLDIIETSTSEIEWWNELDKIWKSIFIECFSFEDDNKPTINELLKIKNITTIKICNHLISRLGDEKGLQLPQLYIKDYSPIREFKELEKLEIIESNISEIEFLTDLPNLKYLNLSNNLITSRNFGPIQTLKQLNYLNLTHNKIHAFGGYYSNIPFSKLEHINLSNNKVQSLGNLEMLGQLRILILKDNYIDKIENLYKSKNLVLINLEDNILKDEQISNLKEYLPNCEIKP